MELERAGRSFFFRKMEERGGEERLRGRGVRPLPAAQRQNAATPTYSSAPTQDIDSTPPTPSLLLTPHRGAI